jgi:hypothetical protein
MSDSIPPDAASNPRRQAGCSLLLKAIMDEMDWRALPSPVLQRMAELCELKEQGAVPDWLATLKAQG